MATTKKVIPNLEEMLRVPGNELAFTSAWAERMRLWNEASNRVREDAPEFAPVESGSSWLLCTAAIIVAFVLGIAAGYAARQYLAPGNTVAVGVVTPAPSASSPEVVTIPTLPAGVPVVGTGSEGPSANAEPRSWQLRITPSVDCWVSGRDILRAGETVAFENAKEETVTLGCPNAARYYFNGVELLPPGLSPGQTWKSGNVTITRSPEGKTETVTVTP